MTRFTANHNFPIPEEGQLDWSDEMDQTFNSVDSILKGIDENTLSKDLITVGSVEITTAHVVESGVPFALGTQNQFEATYFPTDSFVDFTDNTVDPSEVLTRYELGGGGRILMNNPLTDGTGEPYALESYVDQVAGAEGDISPTSVTTNFLDADTAQIERLNGVRVLSSFAGSATPLQDAVDWSADESNDPGSIFVDENLTTDEENVLIDDQVSFVGMQTSTFQEPGPFPAIIATNTTTVEPLFIYDSNNVTIHFNCVNFDNDGSARPFMQPAPAYNGFIGSGSSWRDVVINGFGSNSTYPYTVRLDHMYSTHWDNVTIRNNDTTSYGAARFFDCNACEFTGLQITDTHALDDETPTLYCTSCDDSNFTALHCEKNATDAVVQMDGGNLTFMTPYIEGNDGGAFNAGFQIGDGGKTQGNTNGNTRAGMATIIGGAIKHSEIPMEGIRILNAESVLIQNTRFRSNPSTIENFVNVGHSNHDSQASTTVSGQRRTLIMGAEADSTVAVREGNPDVLMLRGQMFLSEADVTSDTTAGELSMMNVGNGFELCWNDGDQVAVWTKDRTLF